MPQWCGALVPSDPAAQGPKSFGPPTEGAPKLTSTHETGQAVSPMGIHRAVLTAEAP